MRRHGPVEQAGAFRPLTSLRRGGGDDRIAIPLGDPVRIRSLAAGKVTRFLLRPSP